MLEIMDQLCLFKLYTKYCNTKYQIHQKYCTFALVLTTDIYNNCKYHHISPVSFEPFSYWMVKGLIDEMNMQNKDI